MGKANLPLFARILNHFGTPYTIVHDADSPMCLRKGTWVKNGMWTVNKNITDAVAGRKKGLPAGGLVVHVPDFEGFYFWDELTEDKPYHAITMLNSPEFQKTQKYALLMGFATNVLKGTHPGCYTDHGELTSCVKAWRNTEKPSPIEAWEIDEQD